MESPTNAPFSRRIFLTPRWLAPRFLFWATFNCVLAIAVAFFQKSSTHSFAALLLGNQINTYCIASAAQVAGYLAFALKPRESFRKQAIRVVSAQTLATLVAVCCCVGFWTVLAPDYFWPARETGYPLSLLIPSLILTWLCGPATLFVERQLLAQLTAGEPPPAPHDLISFRSDQALQVVDPAALICVSAERNQIVLYTDGGEHVVRESLNAFARKLPPYFVRIHRKHVINLQRLRRLEYDPAGSYRVYLEDEEDTVLPVGRTLAADLKARLRRN